MASVKRNADGEPVAKTIKDVSREPVPSLLNPRKNWNLNRKRQPLKAGWRTRKKSTSKKNTIQKHSINYDVVSSLLNTSSILTFGQLTRGDGEEAK